MKNLGTKMVNIKDLTLPDDIAVRTGQEHVHRLAESIDNIGLLHTPVVRITDMKVLTGGDRIAACIVAGRNKVQVLFYECEDSEIPDLEAAENYHRRHNERKQQEVLQKIYQKHLEVEKKTTPPKTKGKRHTKKGRAIAETVKQTGTSLSTVKRAVKALEPVEIENFGMELDEAFLADIIIIRNYLDSARNKVRAAQTSLTQLHESSTNIPEGPLKRVREHLREAWQKLSAIYPESLCPWCKGVEGVQEKCLACQYAGWMAKEAAQRAPAELLDTKDLCIMVDGKIELLEPADDEEDIAF
jgi:hypothetical protein